MTRYRFLMVARVLNSRTGAVPCRIGARAPMDIFKFQRAYATRVAWRLHIWGELAHFPYEYGAGVLGACNGGRGGTSCSLN